MNDVDSNLSSKSDDKYSGHYQKVSEHVYPSEFLVRALMGSYPNHKIDRTALAGKRVLDLGFGDGRNMALLVNMGMEVHGVEVTQAICDLVRVKFERQGLPIELRVGRTESIPYEDNFFDYVIASSSCYYMSPGIDYFDHVKEIARVLKPNVGMFIHSLPMKTTFIMNNAIDLGNGHMQIVEDPYGVRVGAILKQFDTEAEIDKYLAHHFCDIRIGASRNDYWGEAVHLWLVVCRRR